jgi:hypothetical protein
MLLDEAATTQNIKVALMLLITGARPGDVLFFHFSGHGTQMLDDSDPDFEPDGLDEVICPVDFDWKQNVIRDDDMRRIFDQIPPGVNLTVFLDCCHSGGGMDLIMEYTPQQDTHDHDVTGGGRYLPMPADMARKAVAYKLKPKQRSLAREARQHSIVLLSGAMAHQTAADAFIDGKYQGATTYYLQRTLENIGHDASYKDIVEHLTELLAAARFSQRPQLDCAISMHDEEFLRSLDYPDAVIHGDVDQSLAVPYPHPNPVIPPPMKEEKPKDKSLFYLIGGFAVAAAIVLFNIFS